MVAAFLEQVTDERPAPQLVTMDEFGRMLGVGRSKACELVYRGEVPSITIGRARRIDVDDIRDYIARQKSASAQGV